MVIAIFVMWFVWHSFSLLFITSNDSPPDSTAPSDFSGASVFTVPSDSTIQPDFKALSTTSATSNYNDSFDSKIPSHSDL